MLVKPRNPYCVAAKVRKAGVHEKTEKAKRRQANVELRKQPIEKIR